MCPSVYDSLDDLFDVIKSDGTWLSTEDKNLYKLQKETTGAVGYSGHFILMGSY